MNEKCFDQGTIQAFVDGETSPALSFQITDHAEGCDGCANLIARADEESAQVFALLDREMNSLVPTQRLWSSISVALAQEKRQHSFWDKVRSGVLAVFASPSITVAASVLLVFGIFATVWTVRGPIPGPDPVSVAVGPTSVGSNAVATAGLSQPVEPSQPSPGTDNGVTFTNFPPEKVERLVRNAGYRESARSTRTENAMLRETSARPAVESAMYVPGEESYIRTIASLKEDVDATKDLIMSPSTRVSFEHDLAVVDDSIKKMKQVVRKNPKNQAAKQVLYSSYQNKIDLLNSVVERGELMASLQ
jgi:hypothetical protein